MIDPVATKPASDLLTSTGIISVLGALGLLATTIITAWAALRAKAQVSQVQEVNAVQTKKLDNITVLVDGRYGEVLQNLADMKRLFALQTGSHADAAAADTAQETAHAQHERTKAATEAIAAGDGVKLEDSKP